MVYGADSQGDTGDWGKLDLCPIGQYVVGFALKSEKNRGLHDDTALNGIRLVSFQKARQAKIGSFRTPPPSFMSGSDSIIFVKKVIGVCFSGFFSPSLPYVYVRIRQYNFS